MEKRIELEVRARKAEEVRELNLDNCRSTQIAGLTDAFTGLQYLSMINVGLQNLKGFPTLPSLTQLDLSDNRLTGGLENLNNAPNLTHLNLSGNKIDDMATLEPLKKLAALKSLDMFSCGVTSAETYREKMFELLPQMKYLDGFDKEDNDCPSDESENGEGVEDDDSDDEDADEDDHNGLEYLHSSNAVQDEDETEDFEPGVDVDDDIDDDDDEEDDDDDVEDEQVTKGTKRKLEDDSSK